MDKYKIYILKTNKNSYAIEKKKIYIIIYLADDKKYSNGIYKSNVMYQYRVFPNI